MTELFTHKDALYRITGNGIEEAKKEIIAQRSLIEEYISTHPQFASSLKPLDFDQSAQLSIRRMLIAAYLTNTGPMAAVAGITAEYAARSAYKQSKDSIIIDNGGDLYIISHERILSALYAGKENPFNTLAYVIDPADTPLAICSSSSIMGHSLSLGTANLATVFSKDAALADCAATMSANLIQSADDLQKIAEMTASIPGITGVVIIKNEKIALAGFPPRFIHHNDPSMRAKVTHHIQSDF